MRFDYFAVSLLASTITARLLLGDGCMVVLYNLLVWFLLQAQVTNGLVQAQCCHRRVADVRRKSQVVRCVVCTARLTNKSSLQSHNNLAWTSSLTKTKTKKGRGWLAVLYSMSCPQRNECVVQRWWFKATRCPVQRKSNNSSPVGSTTHQWQEVRDRRLRRVRRRYEQCWKPIVLVECLPPTRLIDQRCPNAKSESETRCDCRLAHHWQIQ